MLERAFKVFALVILAGAAAGDSPLSAQSLQAVRSPGPAARVLSKTKAQGAAARRGGLPAVCGVSIKPGPDGAVLIRITTTRRIPYRILHLQNPPRLVVDFEGARNVLQRRVFASTSEVLERVRAAQWRTKNPAVVRVVADLRGAAGFDIQQQPWGVEVKLTPRGAGVLRRGTSPDRLAYRSRPESARRYWKAGPAKGRSPSAEFPVHQFADLTASLTAPELPPQDRLIPVLKNRSLEETGAEPGPLALVSGVSIEPGGDGETVVDIASSQAVPYRVFELTGPPRLVVDLKDARDASRQSVYRAESSVLKQVRVGQWRSGDPSVVRIVADLAGAPLFDVHAQPPGVRIELRPRQEPGPVARNPFEYQRQGPIVRISRSSARSSYVPAERTASSRTPGEMNLSDLKVLGFVDKPGVGTEAIVSDEMNIHFVPEGGAFAERFRLLKITGKAVEIEDLSTHQTAWLPFQP